MGARVIVLVVGLNEINEGGAELSDFLKEYYGLQPHELGVHLAWSNIIDMGGSIAIIFASLIVGN